MVKGVRRWLRVWLVRIFLFIFLLILFANGFLYWQTERQRYASVDLVPPKRVAIVFGAQVVNGKLSAMLQERVDAAITLYKAGKIQKILVSGDDGDASYNEVTPMYDHALASGVPKADIIADYAGFSTYDTCYRAEAIFGVSEAVLLTQRYHQPRAIYTCNTLGVNAVGVDLPDWELHPDVMTRLAMREWFAAVKAIWEVDIIHPKATVLGSYEGIK